MLNRFLEHPVIAGPSIMPSTARVKTRILIISDTHGRKPKSRSNPDNGNTDTEFDDPSLLRLVPTGYREPLPEADVVLHCGDLTKYSQDAEFEDTFTMLRECRAPLKLVIAGNHDLALDSDFADKYEAWSGMPSRKASRGSDAWRIIEDAKSDGVRYLDEGTHTFDLENGARLSIYTSQWTPVYGMWAFQYNNGHDFSIPSGVDVVMTHGPPKNIRDLSALGRVHAGCDDLLEAVRKARPRVHCFGHIHEGWGAELMEWGKIGAEDSVARDASRAVQQAAGQLPDAHDDKESQREKMGRLKEISKQRAVRLDITDGENKVEEGRQTMFINAAIMDIRYQPIQCPWLIDIDLPTSDSSASTATTS